MNTKVRKQLEEAFQVHFEGVNFKVEHITTIFDHAEILMRMGKTPDDAMKEIVEVYRVKKD